MPNRQRGLELVRMEFRRFLHAILLLPGTDRAQRSEDHLSDHGLQQLAKRLLRYLGKSSSDGTGLK